MTKSNITIVTAFFDIGRSNWSVDQGHPDYLKRTTQQYFDYFAHLAQLQNNMIVFTSADFKQQILDIRGTLPTTVIDLDLDLEFKNILTKIESIQQSDSFKAMVHPDQLKNPECWSAKYVLINNLKSYFVTQAIEQLNITTNLVAWLDFGYCRSAETLNGCLNWDYNFSLDKVNLFSIKKKFPLKTKTPSWRELLNSNVYFIGGCVVASPKLWVQFNQLLWLVQKDFINNNVVDDDQNVVLKAFIIKPELFKVNFLGKNDWFALFKKYGANKSWFEKIFK